MMSLQCLHVKLIEVIVVVDKELEDRFTSQEPDLGTVVCLMVKWTNGRHSTASIETIL